MHTRTNGWWWEETSEPGEPSIETCKLRTLVLLGDRGCHYFQVASWHTRQTSRQRLADRWSAKSFNDLRCPGYQLIETSYGELRKQIAQHLGIG